MKKKNIGLFIFFLFLIPLVKGDILLGQIPQGEEMLRLKINNRPLAKINDEVISLLDVVKKMDAFLYEYHSDKPLSTLEKAQFYQKNWKQMLEEMICNEFVLLDAKEKGVQIETGQIHEELEERFGPHTAFTLDRIGLSFKEAYDWIRKENIIRQMMWHKVQVKALQGITPQLIKKAYQTYLESHPPTHNWTYQVLSIQGVDKKVCDELAAQAYQILSSKTKEIEEVAADLKKTNQEVTVSLNKKCSLETSTLSKQHYEVIKDLVVHTFSKPILQINRKDQKNVTRIFYLDDRTEIPPSSFEEVYDSLQNKLFQELLQKEKKVYFNSLKNRYGFDKTNPQIILSEDYEPFFVYY